MTTKISYGIAITLVALLVISASAGAVYYYEYNQATQSKNQYVSELSAANGQYDKLASSYNASLSLDNETISLLAETIGAVNTSSPIYQQASSQLSLLWNQYLDLKPASGSLYSADVLIDFGNGTMRWYNDTKVQPGWNLYTETVLLTNGDLQAPFYPDIGGGEHFITAIDGISDSQTNDWFLWVRNGTASWQIPSVGADLLPVYNGSMFAWTYCGETPAYAPECTP